MKIIIGGDIAPINSNEDIFKSENLKTHFSDFQTLFEACDLFIVNLESPVTNSEQKAYKSGSSIKAIPENLHNIDLLNINLLSLANNHVGDYGEVGVSDTIMEIEKLKLNYIGAGKDAADARKPFIYEAHGKKVGVLSYSDYEFGIAGETTYGVNPFDPINAFEDIGQIKTKIDYLIVLLHDCKEYYSYPSPDLQKIGHYLINLGAELVVCQHSHVIGATEQYKSGTIVYGQGNFLFDYRSNRTEQWSLGMLITVDLNNNNKLEFVPFKQTYPGIRSLTVKEKIEFDQTIAYMNSNLQNKEFLKTSWNELVEGQTRIYLSNAFGHNTLISKVLNKTSLFKYVISRQNTAVVLNFLRSRVHREIFIEVMKNRINKNKR